MTGTEDAMKRTTAAAAADQGDDVVLMYPDNQLKDQKRAFEQAHSAFSVVKKAFFDPK